jgi:hypothetical protein
LIKTEDSLDLSDRRTDVHHTSTPMSTSRVRVSDAQTTDLNASIILHTVQIPRTKITYNSTYPIFPDDSNRAESLFPLTNIITMVSSLLSTVICFSEFLLDHSMRLLMVDPWTRRQERLSSGTCEKRHFP